MIAVAAEEQETAFFFYLKMCMHTCFRMFHHIYQAAKADICLCVQRSYSTPACLTSQRYGGGMWAKPSYRAKT